MNTPSSSPHDRNNNATAKHAAIRRLEDEFYQLMSSDPHAAVQRARELEPTAALDELDITAIRGGIFIDAGGRLKDRLLIEEGVTCFRDLVAQQPLRLDHRYNLANGLSTMASASDRTERRWHLETAAWRQEARLLFHQVAAQDSHLTTRARANHGNLLEQSYRWIEAYEAYRSAVHGDPRNGVASTGAARLLLWAARLGLGSKTRLLSLARRFAEIARAHRDDAAGFSPWITELIDQLPADADEDAAVTDFSDCDPYVRFVAEHHLALSLTIEGLDPELKRWDELTIASVVEPIDTGHQVPPIFAMFNILKADYLAARWLAYQALCGDLPESGWYADTLDYAAYGIRPSLYILAQRSAIDILDRIAVAASEYLQLPGRSRDISFRTRWHRHEKRRRCEPLEWQAEIEAEVRAGNFALIALAELAEDLAQGGYLRPKKMLRDAGTHRFVVLHDVGKHHFRPTPLIDHHNLDEFADQLLTTLQAVRAALFYLVEMIALREASHQGEGILTPSLTVPPHHWVRGEDEA